jgi:glycosyltransferase involved in cell wall biosynthesis
MGRAARQTSHAYSWPKLAERQDKVYQEVRADHASRIRRRRPRIGLNGLFLVPGGATGGLDPYFRHLVKNLLKLDHESQYVLLTNPANTLEFTRLYADNLRKQVLRERLLAPAAGNMVRSLAARALGLPPLPQRRPEPDQVNVDLIHCIPGYIDDFAWGLPCILTVADIQHEYHPEFFSNEELSARKGLYEPSIRHAKHIIAISKFTRQTLIERFEVAPDKISVVHLGVDARFFASVSPSAIDAVRTKYGLPKAYCIYPANLWPHKNHSRLLEALAELDPARRPHLVLTGAATPTRTPLRQEIQQRGLENQVSWLGYVETGALPALFKGARMMIFPSLFEGFGLPVVEAMGVGCPVACSQTTSLPEVVGEAAVLFDPTSTGAIAAAIESLWLDDAKRQSLGVAGREQARRYSWRNTALRTLQLYRQTIKETYGVDMQEEPA